MKGIFKKYRGHDKKVALVRINIAWLKYRAEWSKVITVEEGRPWVDE